MPLIIIGFFFFRVISSFITQCCFQFFSTVLWYRVLMNLRVNKWSLHLNSSVSCLCPCFQCNPTPKLHIDCSIANVTLFWQILSLSLGAMKRNLMVLVPLNCTWDTKTIAGLFQLFPKFFCVGYHDGNVFVVGSIAVGVVVLFPSGCQCCAHGWIL